MNPHKVAIARQMYDAKGGDGRSLHTASPRSATIGVSRATVYQHLR
jgi:hypothetical protein